MAISVRVASPGPLLVSHQLLDGSALAEQPLAVHVAACAPAASLLDLSSGRLLPKASLLPFCISILLPFWLCYGRTWLSARPRPPC